MARVLIAGCGYVGTELGLRLAQRGHEPWGLRRDPGRLPPAIRPLGADLTDPRSLDCLPEGIELVVYCAAAGERSDEAYRRAYVDGPRHVIERLSSFAVLARRLVFVSSTGVYGQQGGEWVDEHSATGPTDFGGQRLLEGERLVHEGPVPAVTLRLGGIYGPDRTRLVDSVRAGMAPVPPPPPTYSNRIHRDDCAGALLHLLELERPDPLYLGVDHEPAPLSEVVAWLARELGVAAPSPARGSGSSRGRRTNKRCRNTRLVASGYRFTYPSYREGFAEMLRSERR